MKWNQMKINKKENERNNQATKREREIKKKERKKMWRGWERFLLCDNQIPLLGVLSWGILNENAEGKQTGQKWK